MPNIEVHPDYTEADFAAAVEELLASKLELLNQEMEGENE